MPDWEKGWRNEGGSSAGTPGLFWDARAGFYRFGDGGFALSGEHVDWPRLKELGCFSEWDVRRPAAGLPATVRAEANADRDNAVPFQVRLGLGRGQEVRPVG